MALTALQMVQIFAALRFPQRVKQKNLGTEEVVSIANGIMNWLENKGVEKPLPSVWATTAV